MKIERYRGDTFPVLVQILSTETGEAQDIAGWSFLLTVNSQRNPADASQQLFQVTGIITSAAEGLVGFSPTAEQADNIGRFYYDIQSTDGDGSVRTISKAGYVVKQDITK